MTRRQRKGQMQRRRRAAVAARSVGAAGGLAVAASLLSGAVAEADTFTVSNTNASGQGSLYAAIADSNSAMGSPTSTNTIVFASSLSGTIDGPLPSVRRPVSMVGPGANVVTVDSVINFYDYLEVTDRISGLTVDGAVYAYAPLVISGTVIEGASNGDTRIGGGIFAGAGLTLVGSTITDNTGSSLGGGITVGGPALIEDSTIADNVGAKGGGIYSCGGPLSVIDSTITGNRATVDGGGIFTAYSDCWPFSPSLESSIASLESSIVSGNTAASGGPDVFTQSGDPYAPTAAFSLLGSTSGSDITPTSTDKVRVDPLLGPLQNNGGPTPTMAPALNSPVIDQGDSEGLTTDQRGLPRPVDLPGYPNAPGGDGADIGAVELQAPEVVPVVSGISPSVGPAGTSVTISGSRLATATQVLFGSTAAPFTVNGSGQVVATVPTLPVGSVTVDVRVVTPGGESAAVSADQLTYMESTSTLVSSSSLSAQWGAPVTLTAAVSPAPSTGGTVDFEDNGQAITGCSAQPVNKTSGKATCTTSSLALGSHPITAAYSGASGFYPSTSGTITQVIVPAQTTLAPATAKAGLLSKTVSATLTRTDGSAPIAGQTVVFSVKGTKRCQATTNSSGVASCSILRLTVLGQTSYTASYAGDSDYQASTGTGNL